MNPAQPYSARADRAGPSCGFVGHESSALRATPANAATACASQRTRPKKICLFGLFGSGNYGNDGSLEAMLLFLRQARPDAELSCVCANPERVERDHHLPATAVSSPGFSHPVLRFCNQLALKAPARLANWVRAVRHLRQFDMVVVAGTSMLCDYRSGPFGTPYGLFRWVAAARLCGVRFCFVGTGAGPIMRPSSRRMLTYAAKSAHFRSFRDHVSRNFVTSLGIDTRNDSVFPDIVFKLPTPDLPAATSPADRPVTIGVGVMSYYGWQQKLDVGIHDGYTSKMVRFIASLLERGYRVRLLIGENSDQQTVDKVSGMLAKMGHQLARRAPAVAKPGQLINEPTDSVHDVMRQIADTDIVIASRFHNVICALKLARPTISLSYEAKNDEVLANFGLADFCQKIENFSLDELNRQTTALLDHRSDYVRQLRQRLEDIKVEVTRHEEFLMSVIF
jgi:polysaccharide pyruvyl transferase WcaK-like protein